MQHLHTEPVASVPVGDVPDLKELPKGREQHGARRGPGGHNVLSQDQYARQLVLGQRLTQQLKGQFDAPIVGHPGVDFGSDAPHGYPPKADDALEVPLPPRLGGGLGASGQASLERADHEGHGAMGGAGLHSGRMRVVRSGAGRGDEVGRGVLDASRRAMSREVSAPAKCLTPPPRSV